MDSIANDDKFRTLRIVRMVQETRIIAVTENKKGEEIPIVVDANVRPLPVPYTEEP